MKTFKVWVKGKKASTERIEIATHKINALLKIANDHGIKTIDCDGILLNRGSVPTP